MRRAVRLAFVLVLAGGCASPPAVEIADDDHRGASGGDATFAWEHLGQVEDVLPDHAAAAVVEDPATLQAAWERHHFEGEAPAVDFDQYVVLLLGQADDACPDQLTRLEVVDGRLEVDWLPPPGPCEQPLIGRVHAVQVHRGLLGEGFDFSLEPPFERDLEAVTIALPGYEGEAPPPPEPPREMTEADLDAVFADHAVVRCGPEHDLLDPAGPGAGATDGPTGPVADIGETNDALAAAGIDVERAVIPFVDRRNGGRLAYLVGQDDAVRIEQVLTDAFGERAPGVTVSPWAPAAVRDAQDALMPLMGGERRPGAIMESTGGPGPVMLGMVDPTREALDAVADTVDPALVCVNPLLSGVPG